MDNKDSSDCLSKNNQNNESKVFFNDYGVCFCNQCKGSVWQVKSESNYCFRCGAKLNWN